ncbi:MAG: hypothetical protein IPL28_26045 [Chloroflexi bacterium]|nr:hypothetical protein [Chloroflexota bacterium]
MESTSRLYDTLTQLFSQYDVWQDKRHFKHWHGWWLANAPTHITTFDAYRLRFEIEEGFLDDKSNGFQLESSLNRSADVLTRLGLVLALATLYLVSQGTEVVHTGKR